MKEGDRVRTGAQSVDTLGLSEEAIHFDHSINSGLGPPILFNDSVDFFTEWWRVQAQQRDDCCRNATRAM